MKEVLGMEVYVGLLGKKCRNHRGQSNGTSRRQP